MTPEDFMQASLSDLARLTKIDRHRWSRYLNGLVPPNYRTVETAAKCLGMTTMTLFECMEKRKELN